MEPFHFSLSGPTKTEANLSFDFTAPAAQTDVLLEVTLQNGGRFAEPGPVPAAELPGEAECAVCGSVGLFLTARGLCADCTAVHAEVDANLTTDRIVIYDPDSDPRFGRFCERTGRSREEAMGLIAAGTVTP